jgi:hypothetical protein
MNVKCSVVPANSQTVVCLDSTRRLMNTQASIATNAAGLIPGSFRSAWPRAVASVTVDCTDQNVTAKFEVLTGAGTAAADWKEQGAAGSQTVTAGTTFIYEFKPLAADWRVRILAGGTGPTLCNVNIDFLTNTKDFGA